MGLLNTISKLPRWGCDSMGPGWACSTLAHLGVWGVLVSWPHVSPEPSIEFGAHSAPVLTIELPSSDAATAATLPPVLELRVAVTPASARVDRQEFILDSATDDGLGEETSLPRELQPVPAEHSPVSDNNVAPTEHRVSSLPKLPAKQLNDTVPPHPTVATMNFPASDPQAAVRLPEFLENRPPIYPHQAIESGWQGTVWLRLEIAPDGWVAEIEVYQSSGHALLDAAAVSAVRQWRAMPRQADQFLGVRLPVRFELSPNSAQ